MPRLSRWWRHRLADSPPKGEARLRRLAKQGDSGAAIRLSHLTDDRGETLRWLDLAVKRGDLRAALLIATMYHRPEGWGGDYAEAVRYYRLAATSHDPTIRSAAVRELTANGLASGLVGPAASTANAIVRDVDAAYPLAAPEQPGGAASPGAAPGRSVNSDSLDRALANIAEMRSKLADAEKKSRSSKQKSQSPKQKSGTPQKKSRKPPAPRQKQSPKPPAPRQRKSPSGELESARAAAEAGDAGAAFRLWELLLVAGRRDEAIPWLRQAADAGHENAIYDLATFVADEAEAEGWYRKLDDGFEEAPTVARRLGEILERRGELEEAERWYRKAVSQDDDADEAASASHSLGRILANRGDRDEAKRLFQLAADRGNVEGDVSLGFLYWQAGDSEAAESYVREAAKGGHRRAMRVLGNALAEQRKYAEADRWLGKAAREGDLRAALNLGEWLLKRGEFGKAKYRFRQAAKSDHAELAALAAAKLRDAQQAQKKSHAPPAATGTALGRPPSDESPCEPTRVTTMPARRAESKSSPSWRS